MIPAGFLPGRREINRGILPAKWPMQLRLYAQTRHRSTEKNRQKRFVPDGAIFARE
jgi:hypothetical protein